MSGDTAIEWTDATWNPTTGCDRVSPGCDHCYAMTLAPRLKAMGSKAYQADGNPATSGPGFLAHEWPRALDWPLHKKKPLRIFVNSMSDLFHDYISDSYIEQVFDVMDRCPQHEFQILTKRHARMRSWVREYMPTPLPNVWLGVSVESQQWANIRIPALLETPAAVRFLSCEPLLGPLDMGYSSFRGGDWLKGLGWVIVGGESGPGARPMHPDWARSLRDQCVTADVPFLFKQWGGWRPLAGNECAKVGDEWPAGTHGVMSRHVGKKAAGRQLDGRTWDEYPAVAS